MSKIDLHIPIAKREKMKQEALKKQIQIMKDALPDYTIEEIRRFRLPYHEAICVDLAEKGYPNTSTYIGELIQFQETMIEEAGKDNYHYGSLLKDSHEQLDFLAESLKKAEKAHNARVYKTECDEFIYLASHYISIKDWVWLGEQFMIQSIRICSEFHEDGGQREAIAKILYGKFLYGNDEKKPAKDLFESARKMSEGRSWRAVLVKGEPNKNIFMEASYYLYKIYKNEADIFMTHYAEKALKLATSAKKRATEACCHEGETKSLMLKGLCELILGRRSEAIRSFRKAFSTYLQHLTDKDSTENAVKYYKSRNTILALKYLVQAGKPSSFISQMKYYVALAYRYTGEFYLKKGDPTTATPLLLVAFQMCEELGNFRELDQVRNLAAISIGQERLPQYIDLVLKSGTGPQSADYLKQLIDWKDNGDKFYVDVSYSTSECTLGEDAKEDIVTLCQKATRDDLPYTGHEDEKNIIVDASIYTS